MAAPAAAAACDGACKQGGWGGWGYAIELADGRRLEGSGSEASSTNNRQELKAAIEALKALAQLPHTEPVELATDSQYVCRNLAQALPRWKRNGWRTLEGTAVLNRDLWQELEAAAAAAPWVQLVWVKGHNGHALNERADKLASTAAERLRQGPQPTVAMATGSAWDLSTSPDRVNPAHLTEWIESSGCHPLLASANIESLSGADVLQALAGDRLEALGGHAQQYVTAKVAGLLRTLEPLTDGGWWCSGLDPLANWGPMGWGQFKPDRPRLDADGDPIKYEAPWGARPGEPVPTRSIWLRVPAVVAQQVANRFDLELPLTVQLDLTGDAGEFWRWWAQEPRLPLVITEGSKKAGALLSTGVPTVALPGIDSGAKRTGSQGANGRRTGPLQLIPDLAGVPLKGRSVWVLFDHSSKPKPREPIAARVLGRLLGKQGADVLTGTVPGTHGKGADDHLVGGGTWEQLAEALEPIVPLPVLPRLRQPDVLVPAGQYLGTGAEIPMHRRLVAMAAPMGSGKTELIAEYLEPLMAAGTRVVLITHRSSLGAALAERLGLPWADQAAPGSDLRQQGLALCIDSLCATSGLRITPGDWRGCVVVIDEVVAVMLHGLMGTATAVAKRRPAVLQTLLRLLGDAAQVLVADAQLSDPVLQALEDATGERAHLISSEHRPAAGRQLHVLPTMKAWRGTFGQLLQQRRRLWVATTAKDGANGASSLALAAMEHWPEIRTLVVDAETVADPNHDASRLAATPDAIAAEYDLIVATPALAAGVSVTIRGHFDAVLVAAGGTTDATAVAQAAARVRDDCPRFLYAPERSPGSQLRMGCGAADPDALISNLGDHAAIAGQLLSGGGWTLAAPTTGPWLPLWAQLAANQNATRNAYRATVVALLEREGYSVQITDTITAGELEVEGETVSQQLQAITEEAEIAADLLIQAAELITDVKAAELLKQRRRTPEERAQLERWQIAQTWALGDATPSAELLAANREGMAGRLRFHWQLTTAEGRAAAAQDDIEAAKAQHSPHGSWLPDLVASQNGPRLAVADALGLPEWLERSEWFTADDQQLAELHERMVTHGRAGAQVLGITAAVAGGNSRSVGLRRTTTLRRLLALVGYRLEARRSMVNGERAWRYRVVADPLPTGANLQRLHQYWAAGVPKNPPT